MRMKFLYCICCIILLGFAQNKLEAGNYYVATNGNDGNPGSLSRPFKSIQKAANVMRAGETCYIQQGTYREAVNLSTSGSEGLPIRFTAYNGEKVCLDGTDVLNLAWSVHNGNIYKAATNKTFEQLFVDDEMMVEARWPNMQFPKQLWDRSCWAKANVGSRYGKMVDPELAKTNIDWTGALAVLNVAHQFYTWTRPVQKYGTWGRPGQNDSGDDTFLYPKDLQGITHFADKTKQWEDDRYFLTGKIEALDSPGEWFLDKEANTLYLWTPDGDSPAGHTIKVKQRNFAFKAEKDTDYIEISGFDFFGTTFSFDNCDHCQVENCRLLYPVYSRHIFETGHNQDSQVTKMIGNHNTVKNCSFAYGSTVGLKMVGKNNLAENNLIHDFCWYGSLKYPGLHISSTGEPGMSEGSVARYNTLFNTGNATLNFRGYQNIIEYNHVYNGGIACEDVALVYTGQPTTAGSIVRYNWVHGCRTESGKGLGIRGDDQTRNLTVHHNVVWDCGRDGIIVKGDFNKVYNNTVFNIGTDSNPGNYINLPTASEPYKWWRDQHQLLDVQNANSTIYNNAAFTITSDNKGTAFPPGDNLANNYCGKDLRLESPEDLNFRPRADSALVDAGRVITGFTDPDVHRDLDAAPDIGAYEYSDPNYWIPGVH